MSSPVKKPSERLKKKPEEAGFKFDDSPLEILRKKFFRWINTRLGWGLGAALFAMMAIWTGWGAIENLPGVTAVLSRLGELRRMPRAQGDRFSILVAKIENDKEGVHRRLIADALQGRFDKGEVEVLLPNRTITTSGSDKPQEAAKAGHERARVLLRETNANVMVWGEALDTKTDAPMRLHWTVNAQSDLNKSSEKYRPTEAGYDLPELFWTDLSDALGLLATAQVASFASQDGSFVADQLEPFIKRVRNLVLSGKLSDQQQASLRLILADGLSTFGEQRGDSGALQEAVNTYREALKEYTRERVPLDWATTQNNLGNALRALGERESGTAHLEDAVTAYREALKERTRERVPLDWAETQKNLDIVAKLLVARRGRLQP